MSIGIRYAARSDVGMLREGNEDSAYAGAHLLAVADGMGGHVGGEIASAAAIGELRKLDTDLPAGELLAALEHTVKAANDKLHRIVESDPALQGMGTTLTAMLWSGSQIALVHIGDSRAYLLRDGSLFQITHDHTLVQSLVDEGRISPDEAASHPQRSLLLRALDGRSEVDPDLSLREAKVGDRYLLCSDGLSGVVTAETIFQVLTDYPDPEAAVRQLIDLANRGGGPDNITCVIADVVELGRQQPAGAPTMPMSVGAAANSQRADYPDGSGPGGPGAQGGPGGAPAGRPIEQPADTPAGRAAQLRDTMPQQPVVVDEMPPPAPAPMREQGPPPESMRLADRRTRGGGRRWTWLIAAIAAVVILLAAVAFAALQSMRGDGFYARNEGGKVVVYKGSPEKVLGISLSSKSAEQPNPPIEVRDLPQERQNQLGKKPFVELTGQNGWRDLQGQICKYSFQKEGPDKVVLAQGVGQATCKEAKIADVPLKLDQLPGTDVKAINEGKFTFMNRAAAQTKQQELQSRRDACQKPSPQIPDCPRKPS